jgi:hypothetical protein
MTATPPSQWALAPVLRLTGAAMVLTVAGMFAEGWVRSVLVVCGAGLAVAAAIKLARHMGRKS